MNYSIIFPQNFQKVPLPHKDLWTNELRSGNWRQGRGWLCEIGPDNIRSYCCLGVLTKLENMPETLRKGEIERIHFDENAAGLTEKIPQYDTLSEYGMLPTGVQVDFTTLEDIKTKATNLAELNDAGFSFEEIADIIDECFTNID